VRVTSTRRTGSQKLIGIPGTGKGRGGRLHKHRGCLDVSGLGFPLTTVTPAIFRGKIHFQQISVIGLTNRPTHLEWAGKQHKVRHKNMSMNEGFSALFSKIFLWLAEKFLWIFLILAVTGIVVFLMENFLSNKEECNTNPERIVRIFVILTGAVLILTVIFYLGGLYFKVG
jgi:hypothetical protein